MRIFGAVINNGAGGITDGSAILVKCYGAIEIVGEGSNALKRMVKIWVLKNMERKRVIANRCCCGGYG